MNKHELLVWAMREDGVELQDRGNAYWCLCPFHADKRPSLALYKENIHGRYYCFSCGVFGDVFDYLKHTHNMGYGASLSYLGISHEEKTQILPLPGLIDMVVAEESAGVDVVKKYGADVINSLLQQEIRRLVDESISKKKNQDSER